MKTYADRRSTTITRSSNQYLNRKKGVDRYVASDEAGNKNLHTSTIQTMLAMAQPDDKYDEEINTISSNDDTLPKSDDNLPPKPQMDDKTLNDAMHSIIFSEESLRKILGKKNVKKRIDELGYKLYEYKENHSLTPKYAERVNNALNWIEIQNPMDLNGLEIAGFGKLEQELYHNIRIEKFKTLSDDPDFIDYLEAAAEFNTKGSKKGTTNKKGDVMKHFRLDWVRNLEFSLLGKRTKTSSEFNASTDKELLMAIMSFQMRYPKTGIVDGKIGGKTRAKLEEVYPILYTKPLGDKLDSGRILVPIEASKEERYKYYRNIIENSGAYYNDTPYHTNILAIRGVSMEEGVIKQTSGAEEAAKALSEGKETAYFNSIGVLWSGGEGKRAPDDLIVSMWKDDKGMTHLRERMGTTEFSSIQNSTGGPALRDGQYSYMLGKHGTSVSGHKKNVIDTTTRNQDARDILKPSSQDKKVRYNALVPMGKFEVWRSGEERISKSGKKIKDKRFSNKDFETSTQKIYEGDGNYIGNQAINFHTGTAKGISSSGCQNLPIDDFIKFMEELQKNKKLSKIKNNKDYTILYTLIDASKIDEELKVIKAEKKEVIQEKTEDTKASEDRVVDYCTI